MTVSSELKDDVAAKNIDAIRDDLWARITLDPNFTSGFPESWQYCLENGISESELYQEHDGRDVNLEPTVKNFALLCGHLSTNFSRERLEKIKEIGRKLYPVAEEKSASQTERRSAEKTKQKGRESSFDSVDSGLWVAIAIGAISGGILGGAIFGKAVAVGVGAIIGAAAGGAVGGNFSKR